MFKPSPVELPIQSEDVRTIMRLPADIRTSWWPFTGFWRMTRMAKRTPEEQAAFDERTRLIWEHIANLDRRIAEQKEARERHRRRLRRLSFGLLGR